jgi:hypothetical protein
LPAAVHTLPLNRQPPDDPFFPLPPLSPLRLFLPFPLLPIPAIGFPGSKKKLVGSIYGGGVPERDIGRILSLYRKGRLDLDRQIGKRIALDAVNDALKDLEAGVMARTIIEFAA